MVVTTALCHIPVVGVKFTGRKTDSHIASILLTVVSNALTDANADSVLFEDIRKVGGLSHPRERLCGINLELVGID